MRKATTATVLGAFMFLLSSCGLSSGGTSASSEADSAEISSQIAAVTDADLAGTTIKLARFFGDCDDTAGSETDIAKATTECEAIQILTNKFVDENKWGIKVERLGGANWFSYYDALNAALASSDRPDIAVMHGANLPDYASRNLLLPITDELGVDLSDATDPASEAIAYDEKNYALPFDIHAIVSHLNMDILEQAGLVQNGKYDLPSSPEKLLADAQTVKEKTGKTYIDIALTNDPMASRFWMAMIWQQGANFIDESTGIANANSAEAKTALELIKTLVKKGFADVTHDYDASMQSFIRGDSAIMYNGSWAVNQFALEVPFHYEVADAPMLFDKPVTWANSHTWVIPVQAENDPVKYRAAIEFAKFLYEHTGEWAIATGHMPSTKSALESEEYLSAPHRSQYLDTALKYGQMQPRVVTWLAIGDAIQADLEAAWLNNENVETVLSKLQSDIEAELK